MKILICLGLVSNFDNWIVLYFAKHKIMKMNVFHRALASRLRTLIKILRMGNFANHPVTHNRKQLFTKVGLLRNSTWPLKCHSLFRPFLSKTLAPSCRHSRCVLEINGCCSCCCCCCL